MKKYRFIILALSMSNVSFGQADQFSEVVNYYSAEKHFNGAVLVATAGHIDYLNGVGISSRQSGTALNSKSKFRIASITKTFTAVLILQLVEEGKIDLAAKIGTYLPDYKGAGKNKVSVENLVTYSSGIPNCEAYSGDDIYQKPISMDSFITKYCSGSLESEPGTKFSYNNGDYVLLGSIIEKITGKSFEQSLNEKILKPLDMLNTNMLGSKDIVTGLVPSYTFDDSLKVFNADKPYYIENFFSAGAMYSTVEDLLKFDQGIFTYKLLKKATVDLLLTPHANLDNVGLGFWTAQKYGALNTKFVYRPGGIYGSSANWIHVIDANRAILLFSNTNATNLFEMSQQLNAAATGQPITVSKLKILPKAQNPAIENASGTWSIDLRPTPNSEAYYKDFNIEQTGGKNFSGTFYGSAFSNGRFNTDWDKLYFAFTTADKENTYYHSGYIEGEKMSGISFSADRKFISHWTGQKKSQ